MKIDLRRARLGQAPRLEEADREAGGVNRRAQTRPHLDEGADVILVRVGDEDAEKVLPFLLDEAEIGVDQIDAGQVFLAPEPHAAIDQNPLAVVLRPEAVERGVHADLPEATKGNEN